MTITSILLVGAGSFIGGILRYIISTPLLMKYPSGFPWGTFLVNMLGSFCIGLVLGCAERWSFPPAWKLFFGMGILGGFTTFSAFSWESVTLLQQHHYLTAITYISSSILLGLIFTFAGFWLTR